MLGALSMLVVVGMSRTYRTPRAATMTPVFSLEESQMPVVLVANPKGGVGKSTLATNIAGYLASRGHAVMLGDIDRQQSSRLWLSLRPPEAREIRTWEAAEDGDVVRPP